MEGRTNSAHVLPGKMCTDRRADSLLTLIQKSAGTCKHNTQKRPGTQLVLLLRNSSEGHTKYTVHTFLTVAVDSCPNSWERKEKHVVQSSVYQQMLGRCSFLPAPFTFITTSNLTLSSALMQEYLWLCMYIYLFIHLPVPTKCTDWYTTTTDTASSFSKDFFGFTEFYLQVYAIRI